MSRALGGMEGLTEEQRERVKNFHDTQLERALDVLKGISLYASRDRSPERVAAHKAEKVAGIK